MRGMRLIQVTLGTMLALLFVAGCGSSSENQAEPTVSVTVAATTTSAASPPVFPGTRSSGNPEFQIELKGESHYAHAGKPWKFRVTASQANQPVNATAKVYVFEGKKQIDGVGWFPFDGSVEETYKWPDDLIDARGVYLHVDVQGPGGTRRANWPVTVEALSK
jgi:hypothetical protein